MSVDAPPAVPATARLSTSPREASGVLAWLTTTDHKRIGLAYIVTGFIFFLIGGVLAELVRIQLFSPNEKFLSASTYNEVFTMHGSIMMYLFIVPIAFGLANYVVPLQIGAREMAFPRLNALGYWLFLGGGITMVSAFFTADGAASFAWTSYVPLSNRIHSPGVGGDLWLMGVVLSGLGTILAAVNVVSTVTALRTRGMSMFRMPVFTWNMLVTSLLVLIAFPVLTAACMMLLADRHLNAKVFEIAMHGGVRGQPVLWQHLFWFFGHPEVYIAALPFFGIVTDVLATFSWRPIFGYKGIVFATLAIAALSVGVWAHHMFATGAVDVGFFSGLSYLIAVPTGVKFFNWIGTMWGGKLRFDTPMLFCVGFLVQFLFGGLTGVILASPALDFHLNNSYFVVAHMHYVLFGGSAFALFGGIYYWFPKATGRRLHEGWGKLHFWLMFVGFNLTFLVQHQLGLDGMPRRVATYAASTGWTTLNRISSFGAFLLGISILPFLWNVWRTLRRGEIVGADPWDGQTLEWVTSSPPPPHNFDELPPVRSARPLWDQKHPPRQPPPTPARPVKEPVG